ncbi:MAG: FtsH protease activity modulator HflK [Candidatus Cloacimonadota bacterium]|nr:MAG: FtsH protease activity modulator HflK [Candidatus Cloacimonadota bacterium]
MHNNDSRKVHLGNTEIEIPPIKKGLIGIIILVIVGLILLFTSFFVIEADEAGVIRRFGKYVRTTNPGLNLKIPFGIETLNKVKVKRVYKEEFGFRTIKPGVTTQYAKRGYESESRMLTGDLNIAIVEWIVQYRIKDPVKYLFNVRHINESIRNIAESTMRRLVGDYSVDEVVILGRRDIAYETKTEMQKLLDNYETGIEITNINLLDVNPPDPVKPAFNAVNSAKQEREKMINNAWEEYNNIIPKAKGEAEQTISEAEGYAIDRINRAKGNAEKFNAIYSEYRNAKTVTRKRLYLETMAEILPKIEEIYIIDSKQKNILPLLNIGKNVKQLVK